jgi:hypothetical protein
MIANRFCRLFPPCLRLPSPSSDHQKWPVSSWFYAHEVMVLTNRPPALLCSQSFKNTLKPAVHSVGEQKFVTPWHNNMQCTLLVNRMSPGNGMRTCSPVSLNRMSSVPGMGTFSASCSWTDSHQSWHGYLQCSVDKTDCCESLAWKYAVHSDNEQHIVSPWPGSMQWTMSVCRISAVPGKGTVYSVYEPECRQSQAQQHTVQCTVLENSTPSVPGIVKCGAKCQWECRQSLAWEYTRTWHSDPSPFFTVCTCQKAFMFNTVQWNEDFFKHAVDYIYFIRKQSCTLCYSS